MNLWGDKNQRKVVRFSDFTPRQYFQLAAWKLLCQRDFYSLPEVLQGIWAAHDEKQLSFITRIVWVIMCNTAE